MSAMASRMASTSLFQFADAREKFCSSVYQCLDSTEDINSIDVKNIEACFNQLVGSDVEKRLALDQALRDVLADVMVNSQKPVRFLSVVTITASAVMQESCSAATLFILLQDIFDSLTLDKCEKVFSFLEDRVSMWKSEVYYNAGKNYLLRMCNDLLRRLSRSKNTVFCGRIQLFLAKLFPISEKSGLNLMSQFNLENVTLYNMKADDYDKARKQSIDEREDRMDFEEGETDDTSSNIPIDYNLYRKFWSLQDYFRKPTQCFDKESLKTFRSHVEDVLTCFSSFKLDDVKSSRDHKNKHKGSELDPEDPSDNYFAKYLTSEKLLDLQLSDSNFRRYFLVQILIVFQYLNAQVKFKSATQLLADSETAWIKQTHEKAIKALRETPPDGDKFADTIEHIINREENWNSWKNDGCPSFVRDKEPAKSISSASSRKRSFGEDLKSSGGKLIKMGNSELTRLWNLCPDNLQACRIEHRNFLPSLEEFFEDAMEQMDPEAMVDEEYKLVKNPTFAWKALRLLSRKSPHFFAQPPNAQQKKKSVTEYLEAMLSKLAKEMPSCQTEELKADVDDSVEQETTEGQDDQLGDTKTEDEDDDADSQSSLPFKKDHIELLAPKIADDWKNLATELGIPDDDIDFMESEAPEKTDQAVKMLTIWMESDLEKATLETIRTALEEIGHEAIATEVFGERVET